MQEITYEESLKIKNAVYIDVRSPGEFSDDHIPGAVNVPLFDNNERSVVGTIYKLTGKHEAIIKGTEIVGNKLSELISSITAFGDRKIIISCARGGMRSGSIVSLLDSIGMKVYKLINGYKGYRHYISNSFQSVDMNSRLFVLQGFTGSGKTEIIHKISNSIDLEGYAGHRSSIFGAMGLKQNTQKRFESLLNKHLTELESSKYILVEGESRKIGNLHIPPAFFDEMKKSKVILIKTPVQRRAEIIVKEYTRNMDEKSVLDIVATLKSKLGSSTVETLTTLFKSGKILEFTILLLEKYYDPLYRYSIKKLDFIAEFENLDSDVTARQVDECMQEYTETEQS